MAAPVVPLTVAMAVLPQASRKAILIQTKETMLEVMTIRQMMLGTIQVQKQPQMMRNLEKVLIKRRKNRRMKTEMLLLSQS
jgi:hypothetical protein